MSVSLGETIRQLRRKRSLTQTELGGEEFSKSYISAVERDKVIPSYEAVRFFARKLEQPEQLFEQLLQQAEGKMPMDLGETETKASEVIEQNDQEIIALLELVLKAREHDVYAITAGNMSFQDSSPSTPALQKQSLYCFLKGIIAQKQGRKEEALQALEHALALAPVKYQANILDELGVYFFGEQAYEISLQYHQRALRVLEEQNDHFSDLRLQVELHCGHSYRVLNEHKDASQHYEQARQILGATHNMRIAGEMYLGLGYSTYAVLYQTRSLFNRKVNLESIEHTFQLAVSYLLQSRMLYQVSRDTTGIMAARLTQCTVLLDNSAWQQEVLREEGSRRGRRPGLNSASLLDEAEDQCRQALLQWYEHGTNEITDEIRSLLYRTLACLIDVFRQRAIMARINGYHDTALKERLLAIHLCQKTLNTFSQPETFFPLLQQAVKLSTLDLDSRYQSVLTIPDPTQLAQDVQLSYSTQTEIYFVAGQLAEEQAQQKDLSEQFSKACYQISGRCFHFALCAAAFNLRKHKHDAGYFSRFYQRYLNILEKNAAKGESDAFIFSPLFLETLKEITQVF